MSEEPVPTIDFTTWIYAVAYKKFKGRRVHRRHFPTLESAEKWVEENRPFVHIMAVYIDKNDW